MQRNTGIPRGDTRRWFVRAAAILIVVGLHSIVLVVIWRTSGLRLNTALQNRYIQIVKVAPAARKTPEPETPDVPDIATPAIAIAAPQLPTTTPDTTPAEPLPPRQIDWSVHGAYAAKKAVEDSLTDKYLNMGPRRPGPPPEPVPPALFEEEKEVFGEEGTDIHNDPVVRLNKYCYQELERTVRTAQDWVNPRPREVRCMFNVGSREPRGDLFEHLKKGRPLPAPKGGVPIELPERREEPNR